MRIAIVTWYVAIIGLSAGLLIHNAYPKLLPWLPAALITGALAGIIFGAELAKFIIWMIKDRQRRRDLNRSSWPSDS